MEFDDITQDEIINAVEILKSTMQWIKYHDIQGLKETVRAYHRGNAGGVWGTVIGGLSFLCHGNLTAMERGKG